MTGKADPDLLTVRVGQHVFKVRCPAADHAKMKKAAATVASEYEHVRRRSSIADGERAALMVALRMASGSRAATGGEQEAVKVMLDECLELAERRPEN
ncbi:MAG: cell division protein ZapA [Betaproteobacteria bacterium]|nr:cell division protein ZapA [Betaproteobacteria bacterium]